MSSKVGFNVIGHLSAVSGLGNAARSFAQALKARGFPVAGLDIDYGVDSERPAAAHDIDVVKAPEDLPHRYNIICVGIQLLPTLWLRRLPGLLAPRFRNAGLLFWELSVVPKAWVPAVRLFDALVVCSTFTRSAVESAVPEIPTVFAEYPLFIPPLAQSKMKARSQFELPDGAFVFGTSFDLAGDITRKNPVAALDAFTAAFPDDRDVMLLVKCNGSERLLRGGALMRECLRRAERDPRIRVLPGTLPYDAVLGLYAACDAFLSFHRAEGLGLPLMEAMALGTPVIATGFSGNTTFMTEQNSILLPYRLNATSHCAWQYLPSFAGKGAVWADVDHASAVEALRRVRRDESSCATLAERAKRDVGERQVTAHSMPFAAMLIDFLEATRSVNKVRDRRRLRLAEFFDPVLLRLNVKSALRAVFRPATA